MRRLLMLMGILFLFTMSSCSKKELIVITTTSQITLYYMALRTVSTSKEPPTIQS